MHNDFITNKILGDLAESMIKEEPNKWRKIKTTNKETKKGE